MKVEINCPRCNPEGKARIRKLNRNDICLMCFNDGWTTFDKVCKCGKSSGVWLMCNDCINTTTGYVSDLMDSLSFSMRTVTLPRK